MGQPQSSSDLEFYDKRSGDIYVIDLTPEGNFASALRYLDRIGPDPMYITSLSAVPAQHRNQILDLITKCHSQQSFQNAVK